MNGKFLLDSNIIIALFAGDPEVRRRISTNNEVFISSVALGELYYGAYKSEHVGDNLKRAKEFGQHSTVLVCDETTADHYGSIKNSLRAKGRPIPDNDIWIAAIAKQHQLTLVSRDSHFSEVENLSVEAW